MLIAHVITRLLRAGAEENTIATCLAQAAAGHEVHLLHGDEWDPAYEARFGSSIRFVRAPDLVHAVSLRRDVFAVRNMARLFKTTRPTIVHTHQSKAGIVGRIAARLAGVPVIIHSVHTLPFVNVSLTKRALYLAAERGVAPFTSAFVNVSEGTRRSCLEHSIGSPEQHFVARSGMDVDRFRHARLPEDWRALAAVGDADEKPPIVLMLASFEARKRHVEFIEAFDAVVARVPDVRLLLAGEGPMRSSIEDAIAARKLGDHIRVLGYHPRPERLLKLADVTVLTSIREGLPRVFVQSLAAGRPIVTTELPGIEEIVKHGINGIITPADDVRGAAHSVADLLTDPSRLASMQAAAARTNVSAWSVDSMCNAIAQIYDRLLAERRSISRLPASTTT